MPVDEDKMAEDGMNPLQDIRSFSDYAELKIDVDTLAVELGYTYCSADLSTPYYQGQVDFLEGLRERVLFLLTRSRISSEFSKRELLIAPLLIEVAYHCNVALRSDYPLRVEARLQGVLDYYLQGQISILVIEAKRENLEGGTLQLMSEMVALDRWAETNSDLTHLYGAVSIGRGWQFMVLERGSSVFTQDIKLLAVPDSLETIARILIGILCNDPAINPK